MGIPGIVRGITVSVKGDEKIVVTSVSGTLRRYPMKRFVLFLVLCVALTSCAGSKCRYSGNKWELNPHTNRDPAYPAIGWDIHPEFQPVYFSMRNNL